MAECSDKELFAGAARNYQWGLFLVLLMTGGCAASATGRSVTTKVHAYAPPENIADVPGSAGSRSGGELISTTPSIRAVGYTRELLVAAPAERNPAEENQAEENPAASEHSSSRREVAATRRGEEAPGELLAAPTAEAGAAGITQRSADYFVTVALQNHPKIRAAHQRVGAAYHVIPQVTALPDPMLNNTFWPLEDQALQTAGGRLAHQFGLQQGVPWPEKLKTKGSIASQEVQMAQAEVDRVEREITEAVRLAYYELWYSKRAIEIIQETRELVDDLTQVAEARYRSGGTQQDVLRAQLEADRLDDQLVTLVKQKEFAQADLATLVQQPVLLLPETSPELGLVNIPGQLDRLLDMAEQCNPELQVIAGEIRRDRQRQKLACLQKYPDFTLGLNYGIVSDRGNVLSGVADGHDNIGFSLGVTLPVWQDKIHGGINEAAYRTGSSVQRLQAERNELHGKLRRLMAQADALTEQRDIYENRIIPRTEDTLKLSIADYRGKRVDFFTLLETYRELLVYETQLARIDASLAGTVAQIERAVGCPAE